MKTPLSCHSVTCHVFHMTDLLLVVLHKFDHFLGFYDVASGAERARLSTGMFPHEVCLSPDRRKLYVTEYGLRGVEAVGEGGNTIGVYDIESKKRTGTINTGEYKRPHGIATHSWGYLFVTSETSEKLLIYDLDSEQLEYAVSVEQRIPHITNVSPDGRTVYTANLGSNSLTAIDVALGKVLKHIPVLTRPQGMAFSRDSKLIYVVNRESKAIVVVDAQEKQVLDRIETGDGPARICITPDGKRLAFPLLYANAVQIADTGALKVIDTIPVGRQPAGATMSPDGRLLFVACALEKAVYVLSLVTHQVVNKIKTGNGPNSMVCLGNV